MGTVTGQRLSVLAKGTMVREGMASGHGRVPKPVTGSADGYQMSYWSLTHSVRRSQTAVATTVTTPRSAVERRFTNDGAVEP